MSRLRLSRDSDSQVKSGCSHLIQDGLTLCLGFFMLPWKKTENRGLPNCWKSIEIVYPSTTDLFLLFVFFKSFTVPLGGPFF